MSVILWRRKASQPCELPGKKPRTDRGSVSQGLVEAGVPVGACRHTVDPSQHSEEDRHPGPSLAPGVCWGGREWGAAEVREVAGETGHGASHRGSLTGATGDMEPEPWTGLALPPSPFPLGTARHREGWQGPQGQLWLYLLCLSHRSPPPQTPISHGQGWL